jgi:hypothetical protein
MHIKRVNKTGNVAKCNIETCEHNHCGHEYQYILNILTVAVVVQYAMCMSRIIMRGLCGSTVFFHITT